MSLLRLLTAGKTLVGLKKLEHKYHLPAQRPLPEFGPKKNPFRATALPEKTEAAPEQPAEINGAVKAPLVEPAVEAAHQPAASSGVEQREPAPVEMESEVRSAVRASEPSPKKHSPLKALLLWGRAKKSQVNKMSNGRPLIQAELSLDSVKVVRNDLSESDLEVVRVEKRSRVEETVKPAEPQLSVSRREKSGAGCLVSASKM